MVAFSVYCLLMTLLSTEQAEARLARFLAFVILIGYMMYPSRKKEHRVNHIPWYDVVLALAGFGAFMYFAVNCTEILLMGARIEPLHVALGIVGIVVLVELCRRCVGLPIIIVAGCLVIYAFYWQATSGAVFDAVGALRKVVQKLFYTTSGVIGTPINVCYTYIILFVIFGAFLERTGIANFFISLANRIAGWSSGGAAKVAVISSALCGMVSGSSVGNTVTTGTVTIPMMKKTGYKPEFAGAVEAASSSGGQIMPPHHGARRPSSWPSTWASPTWKWLPRPSCRRFCTSRASSLPCTWRRRSWASRAFPRSELPSISYLVKNCYLVLPLVLLVWLVSSGARTMAASAAILHCGRVPHRVHQLPHHELEPPRGRRDVRRGVRRNVQGGVLHGRGRVRLGRAQRHRRGRGMRHGRPHRGQHHGDGPCLHHHQRHRHGGGRHDHRGPGVHHDLLPHSGHGVPTTANYCIMASTCAPILMQLGIDPICAHFFVFYFGIAADYHAAGGPCRLRGQRHREVAAHGHGGERPPSWASPSSWCPTYSHSVPFCSWWATT